MSDIVITTAYKYGGYHYSNRRSTNEVNVRHRITKVSYTISKITGCHLSTGT